MFVCIVATVVTQFAQAEKFSFGVMSDTQWKSNLDGENPGTCAVGIINQINAQFIGADVDFVVQVGDLVDSVSNVNNLEARAAAAQSLYDAGIGFFPLRGNHESNQAAAVKTQALFEQTQGLGDNVYGATNFSSPQANLNGLTYSFDYGNARFVLLDQFTRTDGSYGSIIDQQSWIDSTLSGRDADTHAFVFSHKQLLGGNHSDNLFGDPDDNVAAQDAFIRSMDDNNVGYLMSGHDHMHDLSIVSSTDGGSEVHQLITSSDSYKFYTPKDPSNQERYNTIGQEVIAQELYSVGYYVFTVEGDCVTADFYAADPDPSTAGLLNVSLKYTPDLNFSLRQTFGYSLNGREFVLGGGESYSAVQDAIAAGNGFLGTSMALNGLVGTTGVILDGRSTVLDITTGWVAAEEGLASDILKIWGMSNRLGTDETDIFMLTMSYDELLVSLEDINSELFGIRTRGIGGEWVLAGDMFMGDLDLSSLVIGTDTLGQYGIDSTSGLAWAIVNHNSDFAVAVPEPATISLLTIGAIAAIRRRK